MFQHLFINEEAIKVYSKRITNYWSWYSSADNEADGQRMVVEGRTFFLQWIFMGWSAILNRISTCGFTQIASLTAFSFFCPWTAHIKPYVLYRKTKGQPKAASSVSTQSQYRSVNGLVYRYRWRVSSYLGVNIQAHCVNTCFLFKSLCWHHRWCNRQTP